MNQWLDLHTHILPGMDDGSRSAEESLQMLRALKAQGVEAAALTPHFDPRRESPEAFLARRQRALRTLEASAGAEELPRLIPGAETAYFEGVSRSKEIEKLCLGETGAILLEMPFAGWDQRMIGELYALLSQRRIRPVLAHVERYLRFQKPGTIAELCEKGVWMQANASFFTRWQTSRRALRMLKDGQIHFLGSDCHNLTSRPPDLGAAVEKIERKLGPEALQSLRNRQDRLLSEKPAERNDGIEG